MKVTITVTILTLVPKGSSEKAEPLFGPVAIESQHFLQRASEPAKCYLSAQITLIEFIHILNREKV